MAPDFKTLLATEVLNEQKTLSYRNVARALKVHVNAAKCMLYEFHEKENKKRPGSVYATYIIAGTRKPVAETSANGQFQSQSNGDVPMPSSPPPFPSSMAGPSQQDVVELPSRPVPVKTITLCREEALESTKALYETITSIHIYSLSPGRLPDLQTLTDTSRALFADVFAKQDPLIHNKTYGIIQNPHVRRRAGKRPMNIEPPAPAVSKPTTKPTAASTSATSKPSALQKDSSAATPTTSHPSSRESTPAPADSSKPKATLKRDASSLFKAFAKQSSKPKLGRTDTADSAASNGSTKKEEDTTMLDAEDEGESEDEALFLDSGKREPAKSKKRAADLQREREEKQAKLRKMMEDDAEEEKAVPKVEEAAGMEEEPPAAKVGEDGGDVAWSDSDSETKKRKVEEEKEQQGPRRKRGRRKVMKKKTAKDEDGYLVTREEEVWESFSEDEEVKPKVKVEPPKPAGSAKAKGSVKVAPAAAGKKKGDIMSFFGKK